MPGVRKPRALPRFYGITFKCCPFCGEWLGAITAVQGPSKALTKHLKWCKARKAK